MRGLLCWHHPLCTFPNVTHLSPSYKTSTPPIFAIYLIFDGILVTTFLFFSLSSNVLNRITRQKKSVKQYFKVNIRIVRPSARPTDINFQNFFFIFTPFDPSPICFDKKSFKLQLYRKRLRIFTFLPKTKFLYFGAAMVSGLRSQVN